MENHNAKLVPNGGLKPNPSNNLSEQEQEENPTLNRCGEEEKEEEVTTQLAEPPSPNAPQSSRTPFTNLSQVDADLALARTLQEQERAYMMLRMNNEGSDYGSWEAGSYVHDDEDDFHDDTDGNDDEEQYDGTDADNDEEDAFDVHAHDDAGDDHNPSVVYDPAVFSSDEAYARALQDAEDRDMAARLMALAIDDREAEDTEDQGGNSQDAWEEVDPDELSYEELLALGEVVGTESRGLSADTIASLPSVSYKMGSDQNGSNESCVICRLDYEDGENLTVLSCKHSYHSDCINNWLTINKVCPVCSAEVSTSGNS
ncbi:E3 ubiquitin ligase BIG BROTHER-related-like [Rosa rugosa]|uniref:E3 ubiquitin ligase BIG BROTHER-related-like n=1 Tax=Rosa rugosa TaxID=74645 RepID=UPI002B40D3E7|nr:E3 ubiquitin ligase BIG BROTHER-related-like [Rosa rugosa]